MCTVGCHICHVVCWVAGAVAAFWIGGMVYGFFWGD
jgi:hypothetical protein